MSSFFTVIGFTFKNKVKSKAFLITSALLVVILSILINLPYIIDSFSSDEPKKVGMFEDTSGIPTILQNYIVQQKENEFEIAIFPNMESADQKEKHIKKEIAAGHIDGFLEMRVSADGGFPQFVYKSEGSMKFSIASKIRNALSTIKMELAIQNMDLTEEQRKLLTSAVSIENEQISTSENSVKEAKTEDQMFMAYGLVYGLIILFFMGTMISGQLIATDITAEKSSRVMEILVTSVAPLKQMFGKIIGMFLLGLSQISLFIIVAVINIILPHNQGMIAKLGINFKDIELSLLVFFLVFYILGYFLYATIFAAVGSLVSRTEDLGQAIMPVTVLSLASFYVGIFGLAQPTSMFINVMSYIPFFSPITMFIRIGMADPAGWEIAISLGILLATIFFMGWLSAKIYRTGVLMYGKRPTFKEIRKAMKAFKV